MATETLPEPKVARPKQSSPDAFIDRQLQRTQLQVRLVDIVASLVVWMVAVLASLLVLALCDHWLVSIGPVGRWLAAAALLVGSAYYFVVHLGPLLWRRINSAYAAKVIEDAEPSLKNSLLNFLLLRGNPAGVPDVVVDALRQRAASDLTQSQVDHTVDRTPLIRLGYVLCGVMVLFAAYKLLSPKDPFRTVGRVLAPWADIARPSRVQVANVQPGSIDVYQGQPVTITADISGNGSNDIVEVIYSTADGQTVDAVAVMSPVAGMQFSCTLPPGSSDSGLQQDVRYRVKAGDAESPEYLLSVLPSPRIEVERVELHYPAYTKRQPKTLQRQGDIRAVEGTRAVIHAKANQEIAVAYIEFDPSANEIVRRDATLSLQAQGMAASGEFKLERLRDGRARHTTYQVRLVNRANLKNDRPTLYRVEAEADRPPEIDVLSPNERRVELPVDRTLKVELRARDPDFGLCMVALEMSRGEETLEPVVLFEKSGGELGPRNTSYLVEPQKLGLQPGDELVLVGRAEDNRHDSAGQPDANINRTVRYVIHITAPEARNDRPSDDPQGHEDPQETEDDAAADKPPMPKPGEREQPQNGEKPQPGDKPKQPNDKPNTGDKPEDRKPEGDKESDKENPGAGDKPEDKPADKQPGESPQEKPMPGERSPGEKKPQKTGGAGGGDSEEQQEGGGEESDGAEGGGESSNSKSGGKKNGASGDKPSADNSPNDDPSDDTSSGDDSESGDSTGNGNKPGSNKRPDTGNKPSDDAGKPDDAGSDSGDDADPSGDASDAANPNAQPRDLGGAEGSDETQQRPARDADAIEQINKELERKPGLKEKLAGEDSESKPGTKEPGDKSDRPSGPQDQDAADAQPGSEPGEEPEPGDKTGNGASQEEQPGDKPMAGEQATGSGKPKPKPSDQPGEKPMPGEKRGTGDDAASGKEKGDDQDAKSGSGNDSGSPLNGGNKKPTDDQTSPETGEGKTGEPMTGQKPDNAKPGKSKAPSRPGEKKPEQEDGAPSGSSDEDDEGKSTGEGESTDEGEGKSGNEPGSKSKPEGKGKPGESGNREAPGDKSRPGEKSTKSDRFAQSGAKQKGADDGEKGTEDGEKGDGEGEKGESARKPADAHKGRPTGDAVQGGGTPGEGDPLEGSQKKVDAADTEAENLEYAKKSTDLALKYLKDQKDNPDPELLKKLGWSKDDLNAFLQRWESLKSSAKEGRDAKEELNDAYRSLGLRPAADKRRSAGVGDDATRGNRDAGARSEPPPGYAEQFRAFRKGAGK